MITMLMVLMMVMRAWECTMQVCQPRLLLLLLLLLGGL